MASPFPPARESDLVTFTQAFAAKIATGYATYSLTQLQATTYGTKSAAFVSAYAVANAKATRTPLSIELKNSAKTAMLDDLRMLARIVQNAPATTNAMRIELGLPPRKDVFQPVGPPGTPYEFTSTLSRVQLTDVLTIKWKCDNPAGGTIYQVFRQVGADGPLVYLGGTGQRKIDDASIPVGVGQVSYHVQGVRTTAAGAWGVYTVNYGTQAQPQQQTTTPAVKLAA